MYFEFRQSFSGYLLAKPGMDWRGFGLSWLWALHGFRLSLFLTVLGRARNRKKYRPLYKGPAGERIGRVLEKSADFLEKFFRVVEPGCIGIRSYFLSDDGNRTIGCESWGKTVRE
jgi:hypothetical protein